MMCCLGQRGADAGSSGPAGRVAEQMGNLELALSAYENALRHNPMSMAGLSQVAGIARIKENYPKVRFAASYLIALPTVG